MEGKEKGTDRGFMARPRSNLHHFAHISLVSELVTWPLPNLRRG